MGKPYEVCPNCGSHLDPGEHCDCEGNAKEPKANSACAKDQEARYEVCVECGTMWNISQQTAVPWHGYLCPVCRWKRRRGGGGR